MKTKLTDLEIATGLEAKLHDLSLQVADELRKPASRRDAQAIDAIWTQMLQGRTKVASVCRELKRIRRPQRSQMPRSEFEPQNTVYRAARAIQKRRGLWVPMERLIRRHVDPVQTPLLTPRLENASDPILTLIDKALHRLANPNIQDNSAEEHGCFADIPMSIQRFDTLMAAAYRVSLVQNRSTPVRFLDVGCGGGTKVFAATRFFAHADGLEYDPGYVEAARQTLKIIADFRCKVIHDDALRFDAYTDYGVIYFYRPMQTDALLTQMQQCIIDQARPGTILVAPYDPDFNTHVAMTCAMVEPPIFVTGLSQAEADQLRADAQATGTDIVKRKADFRFDTGFWNPILETASFNAD